MSEFDNLKDKAEQYAQQHPDQGEKGEDAVERTLGRGGQDQAGPGQDNPGQGGPQDQEGGN